MSPRVWLACAAAVTLAAAAHAEDAPPARRGAIARLPHAGPDPALGPRDALVTIELYFVPGSDDGHRAYAALAALAARHPTRLRAVFRPRQLGARHHVAAVALAAHRQGRFFALMDALAARPVAPSAAATDELAVTLGLDRELLRQADRDPEIVRTLAANERRAFLAPVTETPELVVNGRPTSSAPVRISAGGATAAQLEPIYQAALAEAKLAAAQGIRPGTLPRVGRWETWCTADEAPAPAPSRGPWLRIEDPIALPPPEEEPGPRFAWHLRRVIERGTACPPPVHRPGRVENHPFGEPVDARAPLLPAPLDLDGAPSHGPAGAAVPIVVVCNPRTESCRIQLGLLRPLVDVYEGRVRLVWLPFVAENADATTAGDDLTVAQQAICAAALGDGWPFSSDPSGVANVPPTIESLARTAGADVDDVLACVEADRGPARRAAAAVLDAGITWVPSVVIGGRAYTGGFTDARAAAAVVERELAPGLFDQVLRPEQREGRSLGAGQGATAF